MKAAYHYYVHSYDFVRLPFPLLFSYARISFTHHNVFLKNYTLLEDDLLTFFFLLLIENQETENTKNIVKSQI